MKLTLYFLSLFFSLNGYTQDKVSQEDLERIIGDWTGSITYLDYQTNEPFTMAADLIVKRHKNGNDFIFKNLYPQEPQANDSDRVKLSKDGKRLSSGNASSKKTLENGSVEIQTEKKGKDNRKKAVIRYTYTLGKDEFSIRKDVQFLKSSSWIMRSEFKYQRKEMTN